jgi:hypothetical protein
MVDPWQIMDDWCKERDAKTSRKFWLGFWEGKSLDDPMMRLWLGKNQEAQAMRSFIHGARNRG